MKRKHIQVNKTLPFNNKKKEEKENTKKNMKRNKKEKEKRQRRQKTIKKNQDIQKRMFRKYMQEKI